VRRRAVAAAKKVVSREQFDGAWDRLRLQVDVFGAGEYQPVTGVRMAPYARKAGTESRWDAMRPLVKDLGVRSALDIGCNYGWFTARLARCGIPTIGVEEHPPYYRTALFTMRKLGLDNAGILAMRVTPHTTSVLPSVDAILFLAVWHHIVRECGQPSADAVLKALWERSTRVLFFETGEDDMPPEYGLPEMRPSVATWIRGHLEQTCPGGTVHHLGTHPGGDEQTAHMRNLFAVTRS